METTDMQERQGHTHVSESIIDSADSVSYLGVKLPKARNSESNFVPRKEQYGDFINDEFSLDLQKQIAVSFLQGDPLLIEGGTSIGKTTAVRKMASDLGWEVHYANLNGATDVEDLMGRYIPNPNKKTANDPEYVFADGKVTSGLRKEDGKTKVIILDEFNSAAPNILIRLHEVLDSLNRGDAVVLSEDSSETVPVDKGVTKVIALMNPPGKGYFGREPLDPAQLRRWVYIKAPTDLPDKSFSYSTDALFSAVPQEEEISKESFLTSREQVLTPDQLQEIPGINNVLAKYKEFHKAAKEMVKERKIAADQPQPFTFDDRMEPKRVRDFVLQFFNGDINETFQKALRYYYSNKLDSDTDRQKLEEIIRNVEYIAPQNTSQRRGADRTSTTPEATPTPEGPRDEREAWKKVLGVDVDVKPLPSFVTPEVRKNLERMGMELRFIPSLNIDSVDVLKKKGVEDYLKDIQARYPNWKRYESLSGSEQSDSSINRNLNEWFWGNVKDGDIDFPKLPGTWVAVETMPKPSWHSTYKETSIGKKLGLADRFNVSWDDAQTAIQKAKRSILSEAGLPESSNIKMLEALEWNLLANREGWGATNTYEWTNTEYRASGESRRVAVGDSGDGGAAKASWDHPGISNGLLGFRVAVVLGS
jgi:MoxR-like ATPase